MNRKDFEKGIPLFGLDNIWLFYSNISIIYYYIYLYFNTISLIKVCCQNVALCCQNVVFCQQHSLFCCQNKFGAFFLTTKCNILQHFDNIVFDVYLFDFELSNFLNIGKKGKCCQTQTKVYMPFKGASFFYFLFNSRTFGNFFWNHSPNKKHN